MFLSLMTIKHSLRRKASMTNYAIIRPIGLWKINLVLSHMLRKGIALSTSVGALRTLIGLVPSVNLHMTFERGTLLKGAIAKRTFIRTFVTVNLEMFDKVASLDEALAASGAPIGLLPSVSSHMKS